MQQMAGTARTNVMLSVLVMVYALARVLQLYAGQVPTLLIVVLHVVPPALFAFLHGSITYRARTIVVFAALCLSIGTFFESLSLRTGFPFGHYYFTGVMGPKFFQLPILLAFAYLGMGYLSWMIALVLLGPDATRAGGSRVILLPLTASIVMVSWDLAMDPIWTYIDRAWVWTDGGPYFGVPLGNFAGWFLTVLTFYLAFAFYLRKEKPETQSGNLPQSHWLFAVLLYGVSAAGNLLLSVPAGTAAIVVDPSGREWRVSDMIANCRLISLFTMGAYVFVSGARLLRKAKT